MGQMSQQNVLLQGQISTFIATQESTRNIRTSSRRSKIPAYIFICQKSATVDPRTDEYLPFPDGVSRQKVKFVIEENWADVEAAFRNPGGFRDLRIEFGFKGCCVLFDDSEDDQGDHQPGDDTRE